MLTQEVLLIMRCQRWSFTNGKRKYGGTSQTKYTRLSYIDKCHSLKTVPGISWWFTLKALIDENSQ